MQGRPDHDVPYSHTSTNKYTIAKTSKIWCSTMRRLSYPRGHVLMGSSINHFVKTRIRTMVSLFKPQPLANIFAFVAVDHLFIRCPISNGFDPKVKLR
jgi:hypothetical protein